MERMQEPVPRQAAGRPAEAPLPLRARVRRYADRKLIQDFLIYLVGIFAMKGIAFFLIPVYTRVLPPAEYGLLELVNNFVAIATALFALGFPTLISVDYHRLGADRPGAVAAYTGVYLALATPAALLLLAAGPIVNRALFAGALPAWMFAAAVGICYISYFQSVHFVLLQQAREARRAVAEQVALGLFTVAANLLFVYKLRMGIGAIVLVNFTAIAGQLSILFALRGTGGIPLARMRAGRSFAKESLSAGFPLMLTAAFAWAVSGIDRWVIHAHLGADALGVYAVAWKFSSIYQILVMAAVANTWSPNFYRAAAANGLRGAWRANLAFMALFAAGSVAGILAAWRMGGPLFRRFVAPSYHDAYAYVPLLTLGLVFLALSHHSCYIHYYTKRTGVIFLSCAGGAASSALLNLLLVPRFGLRGAAVAGFASYGLMFAYTFLLAARAAGSADAAGAGGGAAAG